MRARMRAQSQACTHCLARFQASRPAWAANVVLHTTAAQSMLRRTLHNPLLRRVRCRPRLWRRTARPALRPASLQAAAPHGTLLAWGVWRHRMRRMMTWRCLRPATWHQGAVFTRAQA